MTIHSSLPLRVCGSALFFSVCGYPPLIQHFMYLYYILSLQEAFAAVAAAAAAAVVVVVVVIFLLSPPPSLLSSS
jgi:hypothetical protein